MNINPNLPQNFKVHPSQMSCNRVSSEDVRVVDPEGYEFQIVDPDNPVEEFNFLKALRYYGGVSAGLGISTNDFAELFHVENDKGGYIPIIVFPTSVAGTDCYIRINIDGRVTDVEIPANSEHNWRPVMGGYFPLERKPTINDDYAKVRFLERRIVCITNPVEELERGNPGLYFEKFMTVSFMGEPVEDRHGTYTCFTLVKFT